VDAALQDPGRTKPAARPPARAAPAAAVSRLAQPGIRTPPTTTTRKIVHGTSLRGARPCRARGRAYGPRIAHGGQQLGRRSQDVPPLTQPRDQVRTVLQSATVDDRVGVDIGSERDERVVALCGGARRDRSQVDVAEAVERHDLIPVRDRQLGEHPCGDGDDEDPPDVLTGEAGSWPAERKLQALLEVDLKATISCSRLVAARMRPGGCIISLGWDHATVDGMAGDDPELFAAVKAGVLGISKSFARSVAPDVRVNVLCPGWIETAFGAGADRDFYAHVAANTPLRRWGQPQDVAGAAVWLASPDAGFVTDQAINVNGGAVG